MTIDLIFAGAVMGFGLLGWISGLWMQLMRLTVLVASYLLAGVIGKPLGPVMAKSFGIPMLMGQAVGTFAAFLILYLVLSTIGWRILRGRRRSKNEKDGEKVAHRRRIDSIAGCAFGMAKVGLILFILLNAVVLVEKHLAGPLRNPRMGYHNSLMVKLARDHNMLRGLHLPVVGDIQSLSRLGTDPAFRAKVAADPQLQKVINHPKIRGLLNDRAIVNASKRRDISALMANPLLNQALQDPEVRKLLSEIDLSKIK